MTEQIKIAGQPLTKKTLLGSLKIIIPLYLTYTIFALSIFFYFIPQLKVHMLDQKKQTILQLTNSTISLLSEINSQIQKGEITLFKAQKEAIHQIRNLKYGHEGKDYFWIIDMHPFMVMHPYQPELEGKDLTEIKDTSGNYPFMAMVNTVMQHGAGYVDYQWQWKDQPQKVVHKLSYVKHFAPWDWIIGTGIYTNDILHEIGMITHKFIKIFGAILLFIIILSLYITRQIFRTEQKKYWAEEARDLEELRLKKLFELSQHSGKSIRTLTTFALEEAINLTRSEIGYLAFLNDDESQLTMHTLSEQVIEQCKLENKIMIYNTNETGLWGEAVRARKPVIINDYENFVTLPKKGYPQGHVKMSRILSIPVFDGNRIAALAGVGNKKDNYNDSDIRQMQLMMDGMLKIIQKTKTEADLRKNEERYRLLAENATDVIWVLQLSNFRFSYVSPAMETLLGYAPSDFADLEMGAHMSRQSLKKVSEIIADELARDSGTGVDANRSRVIEIEMKKKDGTTLWGEVTARFLRDDHGIPNRILGITRDITQRKDLETKLRQSNTDLRLAQRISGIGNWSMNPESDEMIWSDQLYRIFERNPELGPCSFEDLEKIYTGEWWSKFNFAHQSALEKGIPYDIELKLTLPSENEKWVNAICEPESERGVKGYYLRGTIQDITERKLLENRIRQTQKMEALGTLAGGIAHDFNNILSSIIGFTELARLAFTGDDDIKDNLDQVMTAGLRARDLVKHILAFSRMADVQKRIIPVTPLIKESLKFLRASIQPNIEIRHHFFEPECSILADPTQLHQVLMNLFTNAAFAMKEKGGILDVKLNSIPIQGEDQCKAREIDPGCYVQITVSDTGCGIPKPLIGKIFEPFFTTKNRGEGTGMGLSTAYGIIREMQGDLWVWSEPGVGTTFEILIPEQSGEPSQDNPGEKGHPRMGKGRILMVDDEPSIIKWTTTMLARLGYEVSGFINPLEAIKVFNQNPSGFDLILTDLAMPQMTGLELSKTAKQQRPDIPIILCTGFSENLTHEIVTDCGIAHMVMKPLIASDLASVIETFIQPPTDGRNIQ